ncbi:MAG TPA: ribosome maturation factor RimM [Accumulibacter sp.]|uniref:ribosome maturation factor RimM n=1 Tax=Accumulibacter sp. TaxID=2053492 RepID=UPI002636531C|nr:ribosome maturation factor RimM [Accumulibacter sp.]HRD92758.1 ribosome maturation factor RimM [Accumulibacter sp.]HRF73337.1 ribosome maturation factor RimM [Accumulibacter sp.]
MPGLSLPETNGAAAGSDAPRSAMIVLGKIAGPHGLQGAVRVYPFADDPQSWARLPGWWLGREGDAPELWRQTRLIKCDVRNEVLVAQLACVADRTAAEAMGGVLVGVPQSELPPTAIDEYYWAELVGLEVINTHDQALGRIVGLIDTPANAVLRVADGGRAERLLPFVAAVVLNVDLQRQCVRVEWESDW